MAQQIVNQDLAHAEARPQRGHARGRERSRGQVLVIFALSSFVFVGMCAVVVDVAWYWSNTLRVQRAADAAALAGAVLLPGKVDTGADNAYLRATKEATKNGYTSGGGVSVTPIQDSRAVTGGNPSQLDVTITAPVPTFFMRVFGINSINATRSSKGEYVMPVPMGSPQNYYGVGQFLETTQHGGTVTNPVVNTGWDHSAAAVSGGTWAAVDQADNNQNTSYATSPTIGSVGGTAAQSWNTFGLLSGTGAIPNDPTLVIDGLEVQLWDKLLLNPTNVTNCQLSLGLSWNGGGTWTTTQTINLIKTAEHFDTFGSASSLAAWGSHSWVRGDFTDTNFRAQLTYTRATGCGSAAYAGVDTLEVRVSYHTTTTTPVTYDQNASPTGINDPVSGTVLTPQNFWGAIFTKGGVRQNGDYFAPATIGGSASGIYSPTTGVNPTYDSGGYNYTVDFTGSSAGQVQLFDPIFCATGPNTTSGWYGAGDHWTTQGSTGSNNFYAPVAVTYRLYYDVNDTPYNMTDDTLVTTLAYDPAGKTLGDFSGTEGSPSSVQNYNDGNKQDCSANPAHNQWVTLASGLAGGTYRINVETSSQAANANVGAENLFAIWVNASGGKARVYGGGRMAGYTQVGAAPQSFYLAQIAQVHAGKTLQIQLFDPGDVAGDAKLYIQSPDGNTYTNVTFNWAADAGCKAGVSETNCSGTGTYIQTAVGGRSSFDNSMITITIPLPDLYGLQDLYGNGSGLTPSGVPGATAADKAGWWKIYYDVTNANDTTTWMVNILGNPVHLKVP
jgi:hypothetical protein